MRLLATVRCPVVQFNPVQQPVIAHGIVPIAVIHAMRMLCQMQTLFGEILTFPLFMHFRD